MTTHDWLDSVWPYLYIIGITTTLSLNWMWNEHQEQKADAKKRHPATRHHDTNHDA
jgi:hypothetical protein